MAVTDELPGLDLERLRGYLGAAVPEIANGPLTARLLAGGRSNLTYLVRCGARGLVLRRPPLGHVLPTAHDMAREFQVLSALRPTAVPCPAALVLCTDPEVLGAPFYVMEHVEGTSYRHSEELAALDPTRRLALTDGLADALAELHLLDPVSVGLEGFGRPDGFLERQVRRWGQQLDASRSRDLPEVDALGALLARDVPASQRVAVVHGDYRLDNTIIGDASRPAAVLDWEMATLGDPLADLGYSVMWWDGLAGLDQHLAAVPGEVPGFPGRTRLVETYAERVDVDLSRLSWYIALAHYKTAVLFEGIALRERRGLAVGSGHAGLEPVVPELARRGLDAIARPWS